MTSSASATRSVRVTAPRIAQPGSAVSGARRGPEGQGIRGALESSPHRREDEMKQRALMVLCVLLRCSRPRVMKEPGIIAMLPTQGHERAWNH